MSRIRLSVLAGLAVAAACPVASATVIQADFNDLAQANLATQAGGSGFLAASTWAGSTLPKVIGSSLTAPASTNFALTQSAGTAQSVQSTTTSSATDARDSRTLSTPLTGTIWFSFLVNPASSAARGGIGFNNPGAGSNDPRFLAVGTNLYANSTQVAKFTVGQTALVVGQIINNESGLNDRTRIWVNPNVLTLTPATTADYDALSVADMYSPTGISVLDIDTYTGTSGSAAGIVDLVTVSDGPNAYQDVTGVAPTPEPASLALLGLAIPLVIRHRRR